MGIIPLYKKERTRTMDTVVAPQTAGTVVTDSDSRHHYGRGLEGKDVAAINEMFTLEALRGVTTDIHQTARDIEVNVEKSGRAGELATERTAAENRTWILTGQKESALAAATNTAAILAAQAACCCEIKELIRAESGATRDLINSLNTQNLQAQLADAKSEATLLKLKIAGIAVPV